jgi:hypothetical protein
MPFGPGVTSNSWSNSLALTGLLCAGGIELGRESVAGFIADAVVDRLVRTGRGGEVGRVCGSRHAGVALRIDVFDRTTVAETEAVLGQTPLPPR